MMTDRRRRKIAESLRRLAASYVASMAEIDHILAILCRQLDLQDISLSQAVRDWQPIETPKQRGPSELFVDRKTFTVQWNGRICFLGHTLPFRFFERLTRRPNIYVSYSQLFDDVWESHVSREAIRSVVKVLRQKLIEAGMRDLAKAVNGRTRGHYVFVR